METKREFLKKLSLLTTGGLVAGGTAPVMAAKSMNGLFQANKQVGLQIYSLGGEMGEVPVGMKRIKDIGYSYIELFGYRDGKMGDYDLTEYRQIVEDAGLKITSSHVTYSTREPYSESMLPDLSDFWKKTVEDHVTLGCETLVQPSMPTMETPDQAKWVCEGFNKAGEIAKDAGIRWGYHNHDREFERITDPNAEQPSENSFFRRPQGDVIYDLLLDGTDPDLVLFEMDVYWCVMGGNDPLDYFERYAGRFPILHIKDRFVLGASGMMNFENIFTKAQENGLERFYVELEGTYANGKTRFEGAEASFDYLNKASFVK